MKQKNGQCKTETKIFSVFFIPLVYFGTTFNTKDFQTKNYLFCDNTSRQKLRISSAPLKWPNR